MTESTSDPEEHWNQKIREHGRYSSIGIPGEPEAINRRRKERLEDIIVATLDDYGINPNGANVLDVGCGTGVYSEMYAEWGANVTGVDLSAEAIRTVKELDIPGEYSTAPANDVPFPDDSFDVVHVFSVLFHITDDDEWAESIAEFVRVLKPGGALLMRTEWVEENRVNGPHGKYRAKQRYLNKLIGEHGLKLEAIREVQDKPAVCPLSAWLPSQDVPILSEAATVFTDAVVRFDLFNERRDQRILLFSNPA